MYQIFYDENGNVLFDPNIKGAVYANYGNGYAFYNDNGTLLFDPNQYLGKLYDGRGQLLSLINTDTIPLAQSSNDAVYGIEEGNGMTQSQARVAIKGVFGKGSSSSGNVFTSKFNYQAYIPEAGVNEESTLFYYYHGAGSKSLSEAIVKSFDETETNAVALTICDTPKFDNYSTGKNTMGDALGIDIDKTVFVGVSQGGKFVIKDFAQSILDHPDVQNRKLLLLEPMHTNDLTKEEKNAIRDNGALMFVVGRKNYFDYSKVEKLCGENSDARCFRFMFDYKYNYGQQYLHGYNITNGLSNKFGLLDLLSGNPEKMKKFIEKIKSGKTVSFKDAHGIKYGTIEGVRVRLYYRGKKLKLSLDEFLNYYLAIEGLKNEKNFNKAFNCLKTIYDIDGTIKDIPEVVKSNLSKMRTLLNSMHLNISLNIPDDPIGISEVINSAVSAYNMCSDNFSTSFNKYLNMGLGISDEHQGEDRALANQANVL